MKKNILAIVAAFGLRATVNAQTNEIDTMESANVFVKGYKAIATNVVKGYKAIESAAEKGYAAVENSVVQGWNKVEDKSVELLFKREDETVGEAKKRLNSKTTDCAR